VKEAADKPIELVFHAGQRRFTTVVRDKAVQDAFGQNNKNYAGKNTPAFFPEKHAPAPAYSQYYTLADTSLLNAFGNVVTGAKDMNTAFREYEAEANKKIEERIATGK
jgi:multiple sugar transport system substrate-binding protein